MAPHPPLCRAYFSIFQNHQTLENHSVSRLFYFSPFIFFLLHFLRWVLIYRTFRLSSTRWQQAPALCQGSCSILHTLCPPRCLRCLCPIRIKAFRPMVNTCQGTQWHGWWLFQDKFAFETKYASTCFARETVVVETCDKKSKNNDNCHTQLVPLSLRA